jgi:NADPH:quinone reductase-like Zn-dependent oxidoreductase
MALAILAKSPMPVRVLGTVGAATKLELLRVRFGGNLNFEFIERGPAATFEARARDALGKIVRGNEDEEDEEVGFDLVLDSVMGEYFWPNYNLLNRGGRLVAFGSASFTPSADLRPLWDAWAWVKLAWKYIQRPRVDPMRMITENKSVGINVNVGIYQ